MPDPNTNDFEVFDKSVANCQYKFYGIATLNTSAVERPITASRGRNVERYVTLQSRDRVFHVDASGFNGLSFNPAVVDATGLITEVHDRFRYDGLELNVLFAEFQDFHQTAMVIGRPM